MNSATVRLSKFLSYVLRHRPDSIGLTLDESGWVDVEKLLAACHRHGHAMSRAELEEVVATNDKKRFSLTPDGRQIRANQGHSLPVELGLQAVEPPELLYHGTVARFLESIRQQGLLRGSRHHVHLSPDRQTAQKVGSRRGQPVILVIQSGRMHRDGLVFYRSENGVWLTDHVPPEYLRFPEDSADE
jgi:putative RNA 2'-phosphotransferase